MNKKIIKVFLLVSILILTSFTYNKQSLSSKDKLEMRSKYEKIATIYLKSQRDNISKDELDFIKTSCENDVINKIVKRGNHSEEIKNWIKSMMKPWTKEDVIDFLSSNQITGYTVTEPLYEIFVNEAGIPYFLINGKEMIILREGGDSFRPLKEFKSEIKNLYYFGEDFIIVNIQDDLGYEYYVELRTNEKVFDIQISL